MISWLASIKSALSALGAALDWLNTNRLLKAGAAEADAKALRKGLANADQAMRARAAAERAFDADGLPADDPYRRR